MTKVSLISDAVSSAGPSLRFPALMCTLESGGAVFAACSDAEGLRFVYHFQADVRVLCCASVLPAIAPQNRVAGANHHALHAGGGLLRCAVGFLRLMRHSC